MLMVTVIYATQASHIMRHHAHAALQGLHANPATLRLRNIIPLTACPSVQIKLMMIWTALQTGMLTHWHQIRNARTIAMIQNLHNKKICS